MPNTTHAKVYDYTTGTVVYLTPDDLLPGGEAGKDSILLLWGCSTVNDWYELLGGNFTLTYRAANGNIVICDSREVITPQDVHSLKSHSVPQLQWYQTFVWNIDHTQDLNRKKNTMFGHEIIDVSNYDKKVGKPRNGLMMLVNREILPKDFGKELVFGGITQPPHMQSFNREQILEALTEINVRPKTEFGRVAYEILHCEIAMVASLKGYI